MSLCKCRACALGGLPLCERCGAELPAGTPAAFVRIVFPTALVVMAICERCAASYGAWSKRLADAHITYDDGTPTQGQARIE